jgi:hypothetical protein
MTDLSLDAARRAKVKARAAAAQLAPVTGAGITRVNGVYAVKINLEGTEPAALPRTIDGVPVVYEVTGVIRPRPARFRAT